MKLCLIVAMDLDGTIGRDNQLPWNLPEDLKRFKNLTMGHTLIMGRKTYQSLGRPLPGRRNLVISRNLNYQVELEKEAAFKESASKNLPEVFGSFEEALKHSIGASKVFVIGGYSLFKMALPLVDCLYLTMIKYRFGGDVIFPDFDLEKNFKVIEKEKHNFKSLDLNFEYEYVTAIRKN
jgi:dihydrofolate reductase